MQALGILVDARLPRHCVAVLVARVEDDLLSLPQFWRVWHGVARRKLNISQNGPKPEALPILSTSQQCSVRSSDIFSNKAWEMHGKIWTAKSMQWLDVFALQGTNISTPSRHFWVDDFPNFPRWDIDSFPGGWILHELLFLRHFCSLPSWPKCLLQLTSRRDGPGGVPGSWSNKTWSGGVGMYISSQFLANLERLNMPRARNPFRKMFLLQIEHVFRTGAYGWKQ